MKEKIIQQGAEAVLIRRGETVLKRRVPKSYRLKELDEKLRKTRTKKEAKLLEKARKLISVPQVLKVDEKAKEIDMGFISGEKLSERLDEMKDWREVCLAIGENIARLHDAGIIHGDLTTSNMIWVSLAKNSPQLRAAAVVNGTRAARAQSLSQKSQLVLGGSGRGEKSADVEEFGRSGKLYFIDFGLGFESGRVEDKAVDLYLIKEALEAKHFTRFEEYFAAVVEGYTKTSKYARDVLQRLKKVEKRGRYKQQY